MTDIVERLRSRPHKSVKHEMGFYSCEPDAEKMFAEREEAADEIERLRAALEDEVARITKIASAAIDAVHEVQTYEQPDDPWAENALTMGELDAFEFDVAASRAALTQEGE